MSARAEDFVRENYIKWAVDAYTDMQEEYKKYDDYYDGDHPLVFSTERWKQAFGTQFEEFADNWCQTVVDAPAQRLEIIGWKANRKEVARKAEEIWDRENVAEEEEDLTLQTFIKGDGYMMVWPDPTFNPDTDEEDEEIQSPSGSEDQAQFFFNDALDVNVEYDPSNRRRIIRASKKWMNRDGRLRLNLYYKDRILQYISKKDDGDRLVIPELEFEPEPGDIPPEDWQWFETPRLDNPYDMVPVFHYKNRSAGSTHGMSELKSVIPVQNMVNKVLMDMALGSEFAGFPQKWMSGGGHPKDGWRAGAERVWATTDANARFGQFDAMDLDPVRNFVEMLVAHIAKMTQTPMHYLRASGDMPSGEALKTAESGLVHKVKSRQKRWGWVHTQSMKLGLLIEGVEVRPTDDLEPIWKFPETRHDLEQAQTAQLKSILGVPLRQLWSEHFGYTEEQIDQFERDNKQIAAAALAQLIAQQGQVAPGLQGTLGDLLGVDPEATDLTGMDIPQVLALLSKGQTAKTTAGEATTKPQANTRPPASPTRRSTGFKD